MNANHPTVTESGGTKTLEMNDNGNAVTNAAAWADSPPGTISATQPNTHDRA